MNLSTACLFGVLGVMLANQFVMRGRREAPGPGAFWGLQAANVVVGSATAAFGLPGFERFPMISWVVGLLLFAHVVQNLSLRQRWIEATRRRAREAEEDELLELRRKEDEATEDSTEDTQRKV